MGQDWRPNKAFSVDLVVHTLELTKAKIAESRNADKQHDWIVFGAYFALTYVMSLRGVEGLLLDISGMLEHLNKGDETYFIIAFLGKIKGEHHHRCHLLPCSTSTSSGIEIKEWLLTLLEQMTSLGFRNGPAIADRKGNVKTCSQMDDILTEILEEIYEDKPSLFPASITAKEDLATAYSVFRSPRRSSDTRAIEKNVSQTDIALFNRWSIVDRAQGNRAALPMYQHYAQVELLVEPFKRYTWAM